MKKFDKGAYGWGRIGLDLAFVASAIDESNPRRYMNFIYVDKENRAIATDGRRIHIAEFEALDLEPDAYYEVVKNQKSILWMEKSNYGEKYPTWQKSIPKDHEKICELFLYHEAAFPAAASIAVFEIARKTKKLFNIKYLIDILQTGDTWELWDDGSKDKCAMFKADNKTVVLMPIRL